MTQRFTATSDEGELTARQLTCRMSLTATVPLWKETLCLDILVEGETDDEPLVFSSQWMDVALGDLKLDRAAFLDGLHVTWPEGSANDPLQPPASLYDGRHGMVSVMDLRMTHVEGPQYDLVVTGAAEFAAEFAIETRVSLDEITVANDARTREADVAEWYDETFAQAGLTGDWSVLQTANGALHRYVATVPVQGGG
jgi:hypothetical protein